MICRHAGVCGGCSLLHLPYTAQLRTKQERLQELFDGIAGARAPLASPSLFLPVDDQIDGPTHFRQKVAFVFAPSPRGRGLVMGHYQRGSQHVVPVEECPAHSERGNRIAFALRDRLAAAGISAAGPSLEGVLRHLIVRTTSDDREAVAMLVVTRNEKRLRSPVRAFLESDAAPDGFFVNIHDEPGPYMVGSTTLKVAGRSHVRERVGGVSYLISPTAFFQTNARAAHVLQAHVIESMAGARRVLDLYCGSGLFSLPLASTGAQVTGVEENRQAITDAEANAALNRIPPSRTRFIAARVEDAVRSLPHDSWDGVILDPPRQGCSDDVLEAVFQEIVPPRVTYVSCNPESLAAELPGILACGYELVRFKAVDMFPHTDHLEAVVEVRRTRAT